MKKLIGVLLSICLANAALAGTKEDKKGNWNPITIYNNTGADIAYIMDGKYGGAVYGIEKNLTDVYHSGTGDEFAIFQVGVCKKMTNNGGPCVQFEAINQCSDGHYNADLIKTIVVNSLTSCSITCLDGGTTSCKQTG